MISNPSKPDKLQVAEKPNDDIVELVLDKTDEVGKNNDLEVSQVIDQVSMIDEETKLSSVSEERFIKTVKEDPAEQIEIQDNACVIARDLDIEESFYKKT